MKDLYDNKGPWQSDRYFTQTRWKRYYDAPLNENNILFIFEAGAPNESGLYRNEVNVANKEIRYVYRLPYRSVVSCARLTTSQCQLFYGIFCLLYFLLLVVVVMS